MTLPTFTTPRIFKGILAALGQTSTNFLLIEWVRKDLVSKGVPKCSQNHQKWCLGSTLLQGWLPSGLQSPSGIDLEEVLGPFWDNVRQFFWHMFGDFCTHSLAACCKQTHSKSQGVIKIMQQRASKKQLLSSCHLALKSSLANVNELSGPC